MPYPRLSHPQCNDSQESLPPTSSHSDLINQLWRTQVLHKTGCAMGVSECANEGRWWMARLRFRQVVGLFKPLVMFFGLTNSPSTFQTMMNEIFQDLVMEGVVCVYLNDILIYTKTMEEHHHITHLVLEWLCEHKLFLQHDKCKFEHTQIEYLGLVVTHGLITMIWSKSQELQNGLCQDQERGAVIPGFTNFYHRFIEGFLHHVWPLFDLTKKDVPWAWNDNQQKAFDKLKNWHHFLPSPVICWWFSPISHRS